MYLNHFKLKEKPFDMSPGPRFLWLGEKHLEALATLKYGISENKGFLLLTGDVGVGKTALIHRLIKEIDDSKIVAYMPNPGVVPLDFFNIMSIELDMNRKFSSKGAFLIDLKKYLYKKQSEGKQVLLIIDEAQRLYHDLLEEIRLLSNIEMENRKLINIFFVGQVEFNHILLEPRNRALRQRIAVRYQVEPLNKQESAYYIVHRLKVAGATNKIFKFNAFHEIYNFSKGCPRLINIICDHALLTGYVAGLKTIDSNLIKECVPELKLPEEFDDIPIKLPLPEGSSLSKIEPSPLIESDQTRKFQTPSRGFNLRDHPLLIGLSGILIGILSYYLLWPPANKSKHPTTLKELTESLDQKTEANLANRSKSIEISESEQPGKPEMAGPITNETEPTQDALSIKNPDNAPELTAKADTATEQTAPAQNRLNDIPEGNISPSVHLKEDTFSSGSTDQTEKSLNPTQELFQPSSNEGAKKEIEKTLSDPTEPKKSIEISEIQTNTPPITSRSDSLTSTKVTDNQEKSNDEYKSENLSASKPSERKNTAEVISITKPEPSQINQATKSPPLKETDVLNTKPEQLKKPTQEKVEPAKPLTIPGQKATPEIEKKSPDKLTPKNPEESPGKSTLAKRDPSINTKMKRESLEGRVRSFLKHYCNTYERKELGAFARLFGPDAEENGRSFSTLLPKYKKNFNAIEKIEYRIDLQKYTYEEKAVKVEGKFLLKWRPYGQDWRENSGKIFMTLDEKEKSFIVQRLDYYGDRRKEASGPTSRSP